MASGSAEIFWQKATLQRQSIAAAAISRRISSPDEKDSSHWFDFERVCSGFNRSSSLYNFLSRVLLAMASERVIFLAFRHWPHLLEKQIPF